MVIHVSSFRAHHDFQTIIEAVARWRRDAVLVLVGDGPRKQEILSLCASRRVPAVFPGELPLAATAEIVSEADIAVNAIKAWSQAVGNLRSFKVHEYLALGVPTIDTFDSSLPLPEEAQAYIRFAPAEDVEGFVCALNDVWENIETWRSRAQRGGGWVRGAYSWARIAERVLQVVDIDGG
jgi:glycosyltransferase involved in cell wall biosynthesis